MAADKMAPAKLTVAVLIASSSSNVFVWHLAGQSFAISRRELFTLPQPATRRLEVDQRCRVSARATAL
jgi:hypothetical protein